jgi:hypothetical protein
MWWAFKRDRAPMASYSEEARLGVPVGLAVKAGGPIVSLSARFNGSTMPRTFSWHRPSAC